MCKLWHNWTMWNVPTWKQHLKYITFDTLDEYVLIQSRTCTRCGLVKARKVKF
jgi:hypothetical protein